MTHHALSTLLREHVAESEPAGLPAAGDLIAQARRRTRSRRALIGSVAAVAAVAVGALTVQLSPLATPHSETNDPARVEQALDDHDPAQMPRIIDEQAHARLGPSMDGLVGPEVVASSARPQLLGQTDWDRASEFSATYSAEDRQVYVGIYRFRAKLEGMTRQYCEAVAVEVPLFDCQVRVRDGLLEITTISAFRELSGGYDAVSPGQLARWRTRSPTGTAGVRFSLDDIWFSRSVEVRKSDTLGTSVVESVRAPDYLTAQRLLVADPDAMADLAADPQLAIPIPPEPGD